MEQRVSLLTLGVGDLARARRFYEQGLGWTAGFAAGDVVFFQIGGAVLALWPRAELAADAGVGGADAGGFGGIALAHNVRSREEVDAVLAEAVAAGARLARPARETEWGGYSGYFADPEGHLWEVAWNPHWQLRADGTVSLQREEPGAGG
ncbi:MAG TPA: VOC family protein [Gemmatimonadaceae bacterium]|nr:VOC family protein [Gemmatimonadaceae bacterium]